MKPDCILIADASRARLLEYEAWSPPRELQAFEHPASRLHSSELGDAARGREQADRLYGSAAYEARVEPQRKEHLRFARELAEALEARVQQGHFEHVHVFAASPFLGELKAQLGAATRRALAGTHDLDLTAVPPAEVGSRLEHALAHTG